MAIKFNNGFLGGQQGHGFLSGNAGPWTIMMWARLSSTSLTNRYCLEISGAFNNDTSQLALIYGYSANQYELFCSNAAGVRTGSSINPGDTSWHHIAWRKAGSGSSSYDKFLDGAKTTINSSIAFTMGTYGFSYLSAALGNVNFIDMSFYRMFILEQALSDADIASEAALTYSTPAFGANDGFWSFNDLTGHDDSGNGFTWGSATGTSLVGNPSVGAARVITALGMDGGIRPRMVGGCHA